VIISKDRVFFEILNLNLTVTCHSQIIERFYDPDEGFIRVNNRDLKELNLRSFRKRIGYVGQEPVLFNESIKENLRLSKPDATVDEMFDALRKANAYHLVNKLKDGLDTNAGLSGGQLSGGEKQRIALARSFLKNPDLLILDEATSALDRKNESEVQKAIDQINKETNITTIVIAHRLSTIKKADKIIVLDKGEIKEVGTHDSLLEDYPEGIYSELVNTQTNAEEGINSSEAKQEGKNLNSIFIPILFSSLI
jgi:ABC-type multidrug transport system fused ATPase/permease subunit